MLPEIADVWLYTCYTLPLSTFCIVCSAKLLTGERSHKCLQDQSKTESAQQWIVLLIHLSSSPVGDLRPLIAGGKRVNL